MRKDKLYKKALLCFAIAEAESDSKENDLYEKALKASEKSTDPDIILVSRQLRRKMGKVSENQ